MKKSINLAILTAALFALFSCKKDVIGEGPAVTQQRTAPAFTAIDLRMNGNVYYKKDSVYKIEVTAKESIVNTIETGVAGGRLTIRYSNGKTYDADESIRITVSAPSVARFELNTSGSIYANSDVQAPSVFLRTAGSGSISLQGVDADYLEADASVSGTISISSGVTATQKLKTSGSASIQLSGVSAKKVEAHTTGSGSVRVNVSDELAATIDGSGSIYFRGFPVLQTRISGTGHLIRY